MKKQTKYAVLHILTATYLFSFDTKKRMYCIVIFPNLARAGHGINDYINQDFTIRPYGGYGLYLEADILNCPNNIRNPWDISQSIRNAIKKDGKLNKSEFIFVPIKENNEDNKED